MDVGDRYIMPVTVLIVCTADPAQAPVIPIPHTRHDIRAEALFNGGGAKTQNGGRHLVLTTKGPEGIAAGDGGARTAPR